MFIKTTSIPPKYLPSNSCVLEIGFERSKSILPFSSISGTKLEEAKIASSRHRFDKGAVIINCIFVITSASIKPSPDGFIFDKIESAFTKLETTASPIKKIIEMAAKKIKTLRAKASLRVYHEITNIFFTSCSSFLLH